MIGSLHEAFPLGCGRFPLSEDRNILYLLQVYDILGRIMNKIFLLVHGEDPLEDRRPFGFFDGRA
jgi:hypothetical protein